MPSKKIWYNSHCFIVRSSFLVDFTLFCGKNSFISIFTVSLQNMFCPDLRTFYVEKNCGQNFVGGGKMANIMYAYLGYFPKVKKPNEQMISKRWISVGWKLSMRKPWYGWMEPNAWLWPNRWHFIVDQRHLVGWKSNIWHSKVRYNLDIMWDQDTAGLSFDDIIVVIHDFFFQYKYVLQKSGAENWIVLEECISRRWAEQGREASCCNPKILFSRWL